MELQSSIDNNGTLIVQINAGSPNLYAKIKELAALSIPIKLYYPDSDLKPWRSSTFYSR